MIRTTCLLMFVCYNLAAQNTLTTRKVVFNNMPVDSLNNGSNGAIYFDKISNKYRFWDPVSGSFFSFNKGPGGGSVNLLNGNGTTFNVDRYDIGGEITGNISLDGNFPFYLGSNIPLSGYYVAAGLDNFALNDYSSIDMSTLGLELYTRKPNLAGFDISQFKSSGSELFITTSSNLSAEIVKFKIGGDLAGSVVFTDNRTLKQGILYGGSDYVTDPLSLTTKEWVENYVTNGGINWQNGNGITFNSNKFNLGGSLFQDATINGFYNVNFGEASNRLNNFTAISDVLTIKAEDNTGLISTDILMGTNVNEPVITVSGNGGAVGFKGIRYASNYDLDPLSLTYRQWVEDYVTGVVGGGSVTSVFGRSGTVTAQSGDYDASMITNTPNGNIASTDVQAAINELDTEKADISHSHVIADVSGLQTELDNKLNSASVSAFGLTLIDDANASTARTTLGLGTLATQNGTFSGTSSGTNTGDQTSIVGISGTKTQYNTSLTDGDFLFVGDIIPGINTLNGLTSLTQSFSVGTSGTDFNISSTTSTHTFNIPDASITNRGVITTGVQSIGGIKTFSSITNTLNIIDGLELTATSGGTKILTASSARMQHFTGSLTHTLVLPSALTLSVGHKFEVYNAGSNAITINTNLSGTITILPANSTAYLRCSDNSSQNGIWEFDRTSRTGVTDCHSYIILTTSNPLTNTTAFQPIFDNVGDGSLLVDANSTYRFECHYALAGLSTTSSSFGFALTGPATITSTEWDSYGKKAALLTASALSGISSNSTSATTVVQASTSSTGHVTIRGIFRTANGGTITAQLNLTSAAAATVSSNSYIIISKEGTSTTTTINN